MILEDVYVDYLINNNLTQSQFLLLHLIYKKRYDLVIKYKKNFPYSDEDSSMIGSYLTNELITRGFLVQDKKGIFKVGNKFLETFGNKHTMTDEIFELYPSTMELNGSIIPLSAMDRNVFANLYDEMIQSSLLEHLEVIKDIEFAIEQGLLKLGIDKFLKSKYWLTIRKIRLNKEYVEKVVLKNDNEFNSNDDEEG